MTAAVAPRRVGRMADPQEFEYLKFDKNRFEAEVLNELLELCSEAVYVQGDTVIIRHLFTERRMIPLNIFLANAEKEKAKKATGAKTAVKKKTAVKTNTLKRKK